MKVSTFAVLSGFAFCASALGPRDKITGSSKDVYGRTVLTYDAGFDDVSTALIPGVPVRGLKGLGLYDNLYFNNIGVAVDNILLSGVPPASPPNVLGFDVVSSLIGGSQNITSIHEGSLVEFFSLQSFYLGCVVSSQETAASIPTACDITLTGHRDGQEVGIYEARFDPEGRVKAEMQQYHVSEDLHHVDTIVIEKRGSIEGALFTVLLDDMRLAMTLKHGL